MSIKDLQHDELLLICEQVFSWLSQDRGLPDEKLSDTFDELAGGLIDPADQVPKTEETLVGSVNGSSSQAPGASRGSKREETDSVSFEKGAPPLSGNHAIEAQVASRRQGRLKRRIEIPWSTGEDEDAPEDFQAELLERAGHGAGYEPGAKRFRKTFATGRQRRLVDGDGRGAQTKSHKVSARNRYSFTYDEDELLVELIKKCGYGSWGVILNRGIRRGLWLVRSEEQLRKRAYELAEKMPRFGNCKGNEN